MAKINLGYDLGNEDRDGGSDLIEAGLYLTEITKANFVEGKDGKADSIFVNLKVLDAESDELKKHIGCKFLDVVSMSDAARWRVVQLCDAAFGRTVKGDELDTDDLEGKKMVTQTMVDDYGGKLRTKVDRHMPLSKWHGSVDGKTASDKAGGKKIGADDEEVDL